jgi:hypothetical protein
LNLFLAVGKCLILVHVFKQSFQQKPKLHCLNLKRESGSISRDATIPGGEEDEVAL